MRVHPLNALFALGLLAVPSVAARHIWTYHERASDRKARKRESGSRKYMGDSTLPGVASSVLSDMPPSLVSFSFPLPLSRASALDLAFCWAASSFFRAAVSPIFRHNLFSDELVESRCLWVLSLELALAVFDVKAQLLLVEAGREVISAEVVEVGQLAQEGYCRPARLAILWCVLEHTGS